MDIENEETTTKEVAKEIKTVVNDLGKRSRNFEMCQDQATSTLQLTDELRAAREETRILLTNVEKLELENSELKRQLLMFNQETEGDQINLDDKSPNEVGASDNNAITNPILMETGKDPMEVFPEEVWEMIFGHLKDPKDMKSCYETCTKFQTMLQRQAKIFLFTDVLKILAAWDPWIVSRLSGVSRDTPLIKCRTVCHGWKQSVDIFLQDDTPNFPHLPVNKMFVTRTPAKMIFKKYKNPWKYSMWRDMSSEFNPFPRRYLMYRDDFEGTRGNQRYHSDFRSFLKKFGSHIWFFEAQFSMWNTQGPTSWYTELLIWLSLMPNLKMLYLRRPSGEWYHSSEDSSGSEEDSDNLEQFEPYPTNAERLRWLSETLNVFHFPTVTTMKIVALEDCPPSLMEAILGANPQIERMYIKQTTGNMTEINMNSMRLEKLHEFSLVDQNRLYLDFEKVSWKLRKLTLETSYAGWARLFDILGKRFGETLLELNLDLCGTCYESPKLYLPKLKKLKLELAHCFNSIDFILPLNDLEHLSVELTDMEMRKYQEKDKDYKPLHEIIETIQFHQYTQNLKNSNVWQFLPKLKSVRVCRDSEWRSCTRDQVIG